MDAEHLEEALAWLPGRVRELMAITGTPGCAIGVAAGGAVAYADGFGIADLRTGAPVTAGTRFQLASLSKPLAATVIARVVARGTVGWDTPVRDLLPGFATGDAWIDANLTIGDCLAHRTGFPDHAAEDLIDLGYTWREAMARLPLIPRGPFRAGHAYTNVLYAIAGFAVAEAAGTDWATLSRNELVAPLDLTRTTASYREFAGDADRAAGHVDWDGEWRVAPDEYDTDVAAPAAGFASCADDLARWMASILALGADREPVAPWAAFAPALTVQSVRRPASAIAETEIGYGYGFMLSTTPDGLRLVHHSGVFSQGFTTVAVMAPALDVGVVVLSNGLLNGITETIAWEFLDVARGGAGYRTGEWWARFGEQAAQAKSHVDGALTGRERPRDSAPPSDPEACAGRYANEYFGDADVRVERRDPATLSIRLGPRPAPAGIDTVWIAEHWDGDTYIVRDLHSPEVPPASTSAVEFDPAAGTMRFELFDRLSYGNGVFTRRAA